MMTGPLSPYCPLYRGFTVISNTRQTSGYNGKRVMILGFIVCILINSHIPSASYVARKREQVCGGTAPSEQDGLDQDVVHNHVQVHASAHSSQRNWARAHVPLTQVPVGFLEKMREFEFPHLDRLITIVDLIDAPLDMSGIEKLPERIQSVVAWDAHQSFPWINWHVATLAAGHSSPGAQHYSSIGATIFLLTLPGTVSVHYGDEINLHGPKQGKVEPHNWTSIMQWTDQKFAGFSTTDPWKSLSPGWDFNNVYNHNHTIEPVRQMIKLRQEKVPIYVNGIFNYEGDYHPTKSTNYKMRIARDGLVVLDRFYPRRHQYAVISNLSPQLLDADISHLYYGGAVAVSSHDKEGYLIFKNVTLAPGEGLLCILDK